MFAVAASQWKPKNIFSHMIIGLCKRPYVHGRIFVAAIPELLLYIVFLSISRFVESCASATHNGSVALVFVELKRNTVVGKTLGCQLIFSLRTFNWVLYFFCAGTRNSLNSLNFLAIYKTVINLPLAKLMSAQSPTI